MEKGGHIKKGHNLRYYILSFAIIIPLFRPRSIGQFGGAEQLFYLAQILFTVAITFYCFIIFIRKKTHAFSAIAWMVIAYKAWETIAIYKNGYGNLATIINAFAIIGATVFTEHMIRKAPFEYLSSLSFYTGFLVFVNNISYFLGGFKGLTDATGNIVYFWSTRNHLSSLFVIALISSFVINGMKRSKVSSFWNLFVVINVLWGTITFKSATTIAGIAVYIILFYLFKKRTALYQPVMFYLAGLGLNIAIVILRIQEIFSYIIETLLQKSLTFNGRTDIWDVALLYLIRSPFWGYGRSSLFSFTFAETEIPAHNQFLDIGIVCGIPGIILFMIILLLVFMRLKNYEDSMIARIICCSLLAFVIMSISESPNPYQPWFILFGIVSFIPELDKYYIYISYNINEKGVLTRKRIRGNM